MRNPPPGTICRIAGPRRSASRPVVSERDSAFSSPSAGRGGGSNHLLHPFRNLTAWKDEDNYLVAFFNGSSAVGTVHPARRCSR